MATKQKYKQQSHDEVTATAINTKRKYIVTNSFNGQINNVKFEGRTGEVIEMEPWQANLLKTYVTEELQ